MNSDILKAATLIEAGDIVAFPTETVYGLGANARNDQACQKIFALKKRPSFNPLIVHVADLKQAEELAEFNDNAYKLSKFWPGPLTLVLPLKPNSNIAKSVLAGLNTIAIRIPAHKTASSLINTAACPIAAPSANLSGYVSASTKEHVLEDFGEQIFVLPDSERNSCGLESTIIDLSTNHPTLLRYGFITTNVVEDVLGSRISISESLMQIKAPGMMDKHYSPKTAIRLNATSLNQNEIGLNFGFGSLEGTHLYYLDSSKSYYEPIQSHPESLRSHPESLRSHPESLRSHPESLRSHPESLRSHPESLRSHPESLRSHPELVSGSNNHCNLTNNYNDYTKSSEMLKQVQNDHGCYMIPRTIYNLSPSGNLIEAAQNLYSMLRELDKFALKNNIHTVAIAPIPIEGIGAAINDRLKRAAFKS